MRNQKGIGSMTLIIAVVLVALGLFFVIYRFGFFSQNNTLQPLISPSPSSVTINPEQDPSYNLVKEQFNLSAEQLEILSRTKPDDNRF